MHLVRSATVPLVAALILLLVGGAVLGTSLRSQQEARDDLAMLRIANDNLEMVTQARIDEVRGGQDSLAITGADDASLTEHVDFLREIAPDTSSAGLEDLLTQLATLGTPEEGSAPMIGLSLAVDSLARDTTTPVLNRLEAAQTRVWWSFWLTGLTVVTLLSLGLARGRQRDLGVAGAAGSINPRFTDV